MPTPPHQRPFLILSSKLHQRQPPLPLSMSSSAPMPPSSPASPPPPPPTLRVMRLYPPPLHPPPSSSPLTSALGLPPSFGLIHTGSPFTFHLSLLPHPETPPGTSQLTIKLQTPQARIPLLSVSHDSREQKTIIHSVPLTSEGPHTLRVLSTSDNGATLRKFYKVRPAPKRQGQCTQSDITNTHTHAHAQLFSSTSQVPS